MSLQPKDKLQPLLCASDEGQTAVAIARCVAARGGRAYFVGGSLRDALLGQVAQDIDLEVYGIAPDALLNLLASRWPVTAVGKSFGVFKIRHTNIDIAVPRTETKTGTGHRGFSIDADPSLPPQIAARRRDFTINALLWDPLNGELLDPCGGLEDLANKTLRHTSPQFAEDPLRVLRAMQFIARFNLAPAEETVLLSQTITPEGLSSERQMEEWDKLILAGQQIAAGLRFLRASGWIQYYPELEALIGCPQDPIWHPEGDVWQHTLHCMDAFAQQRIGDPKEDRIIGWAVLCHDLGKPFTTKTDPATGRIRSLGHESAGEAPTLSLLQRLTREKSLIDEVVLLVKNHHKPYDLYRAQSSDAAIRRLAARVGRIDRLLRVAAADGAGRPPLPVDPAPLEWLAARANNLQVSTHSPRPLIMGRHLIERGLQPGKHFKPLLDACFEAQLEGRITTAQQAQEFLTELLQRG